jgi:hypothetical protein
MKGYMEHLKNAQEFARYAQSLMYRDFSQTKLLAENDFEYHYCESGLYAIRDKQTRVISLVLANSPAHALATYLGVQNG